MDFIYPCNICIVNACCTIHCIEHFRFINRIICLFPDEMTKEQIEEYYESTPIKVKKTINEFIKDGKLYSFPDDWESPVARYVELK